MVVDGGRVVIVAVAVAVAVEGRGSVVDGSRWLGWEVVGSMCGSGYKVVVVAAASHGENVSFVFHLGFETGERHT